MVYNKHPAGYSSTKYRLGKVALEQEEPPAQPHTQVGGDTMASAREKFAAMEAASQAEKKKGRSPSKGGGGGIAGAPHRGAAAPAAHPLHPLPHVC